MFTITNIMEDINKGCAINNLNENAFTYRVAYYVNEGNISKKHHMDSSFDNLRQTLEKIIQSSLSLTNNIVISSVTVKKNGKCVYLLSRSYKFCLDGYFRWITDQPKNRNLYGRYAAARYGN